MAQLLRALWLSTLSLALLAALPAEASPPGGYWVQVVKPGDSIQAAIDQAKEGGWIFVLPGTYHETADDTNGLNITKSLHLIGFSTPKKKVVLENSGDQQNGIAAVPAAHTDCMSCHSTLAPPFSLLPGVESSSMMDAPTIYGLTITGITIKDFTHNGLFARGLDGFLFADVHSEGNKNYGIFPVSSKNGVITNSSAMGTNDSGIWVETSENVKVTHNEVAGNVNGFEVSNSENILLEHNDVHDNTIGMALLFLPDIFPVHGDARNITVRENHVYHNNKENTAREGAILSTVPPGVGILNVGVDDSVFADNLVEDNEFIGIAIVDYCLVVAFGPFPCNLDPDVLNNPGFVPKNTAENNQVLDNTLNSNGTVDNMMNPFNFARSDLGLLTAPDAHGNCYDGNLYSTFFSLIGFLPACP